MEYREELKWGKVMELELMDGEKECEMVEVWGSKVSGECSVVVGKVKLKVDDKFEKVEKLCVLWWRDMGEMDGLVNRVEGMLDGYSEMENGESGKMMD